MPLTLSSIAIEEKNKLSTDSIWYLAMKVTIPGSTPDHRPCREEHGGHHVGGSDVAGLSRLRSTRSPQGTRERFREST